MLPRLRSAHEQVPVDVRDRYAAAVVTPFGSGPLDNELPWAAVRQVITEPGDGDDPDDRLTAAITAASWAEEDVSELARQVGGHSQGSEHPEFWLALAEEVAAAGGVPGPGTD